MATGNVLLAHWYTGANSYWTFDDVAFAMGVLLVGMKVVLLHVVSAFTWTALIVTGAFAASLDTRNRGRATAFLTVLALLGVPSLFVAGDLSQSSVHAGTILLALLAFVGLRNGRFGWSWFISVVILALGTLGDPLLVAFGLIPLLIVGALDSIRLRKWDYGLPTSTAALLAMVLAGLLRLAAVHVGTYHIVASRFAAPAQILSNLRNVIPSGLSLLGPGTGIGTIAKPVELEPLRLASAVVVCTGILVGVGNLLLGLRKRESRPCLPGLGIWTDAGHRLDDLLIFGTVGSAATFVVLHYKTGSLEYLTPGVVFGSIISAALLGRMARRYNTGGGARAAAVLGLALIVSYAAIAGATLSQTTPTSSFIQLVSFLRSHDLHRGVGDYWSSAPTTVYSEGSVVVRQVALSSNGGIEPLLCIAKDSWYTGSAHFLLLDVARNSGRLIRHGSKYPFAAVANIYKVGEFRIVVWKRPVPLLRLARNGSQTCFWQRLHSAP